MLHALESSVRPKRKCNQWRRLSYTRIGFRSRGVCTPCYRPLEESYFNENHTPARPCSLETVRYSLSMLDVGMSVKGMQWPLRCSIQTALTPRGINKVIFLQWNEITALGGGAGHDRPGVRADGDVQAGMSDRPHGGLGRTGGIAPARVQQSDGSHPIRVTTDGHRVVRYADRIMIVSECYHVYMIIRR